MRDRRTGKRFDYLVHRLDERLRPAAGACRRASLWLLAAAAAGAGCNAPRSSPSNDDASSAAAPPSDGYVRLERGVQPLARPEFDLGPLDPDRRLSNLAVVFKLSPEQKADRDALAAAQLDPSSPSYHKWLTPEEYAARFGAAASDIARTRAWLGQQGLEVRATSPLGARVSFAGRVADLQTAFRTEIHRYEIGSEIHYAMSGPPAVPADLSSALLAVFNTHDFYPRPSVRPAPVPQAVCPAGDPLCRPLENFGLDPQDWAKIYDVAPLYASKIAGSSLDGSGVAIAIVGASPIAQSDVSAFRTRYGLPASTVTMTLVPGTGAPAPASEQAADSELEAILDTEWSGGIAPGAQIDLVYTGVDDPDLFDAALYAIEQNVAPILSESAGRCEADLSQSDADVIGIYGSAANLLGITYLAASGDGAATSCLASEEAQATGEAISGLYVSEPASFPGITSVGGTEFLDGTLEFDCNGAAVGYATPEQVWNETELTTTKSPAGGGGGISVLFARPSYQAAVPTCAIVGSLPENVDPSSMRQVPDVALTAAAGNNPYFIECTPLTVDGGVLVGCSSAGGNPQLIAVGGTSASTPSFAGVLALVNQAIGGRLGNVNPQLYGLSATAPSGFHDITTGSNLIECKPGVDLGCPSTPCPESGVGAFCYGYQAAAGYDCASGLGSIDAANLVRAWANLTPTTTTLSAAPAAIAEGAGVNLTAAVGAAVPNASAIGGTVTFLVQSYGENGAAVVPGGVVAINPIAYSIGSAALTGGTTSSATVTLATGAATTAGLIGVGLVRPGKQYVDVSAAYGGDPQHLASTSPPVRVTFTGVDLCIVQSSESVRPDGTIAYSASGGVAPIQWELGFDSTCDENGDCSAIDATSGAFTAGPEPGYVIVEAIDEDGAIAIGFVTVGNPGGTPPWDTGAPTSCATADAGAAGDGAAPPEETPPSDAASEGQESPPCDGGKDETGADAAGQETGAGDSGGPGCGCRTAGRSGAPPAGALGALVLGLGLISRRRRDTRAPGSGHRPTPARSRDPR